MIDGTYAIYVNTLLGKQSGTVVLKTDGDTMVADIDAPVVGKQVTEGKIDGNTFMCEGNLSLGLFGKVAYKLHGEVDGDDLHIVINSSSGDIVLEGARVQ